MHPSFRCKRVIKLLCKFCDTCICNRGMKAVLLADTNVQMYSTDMPPSGKVDVMGKSFSTPNCDCKIKEAGCTSCGNVVGYHVVTPCLSCLKACNNGHTWMFYSESTWAFERLDEGLNHLQWDKLPSADEATPLDPVFEWIEDFECCR
ncbi:protein FAM72A-like [Anneissia japonica]|uniref:protein FAM72A-like n=1 Tax=Anneissia japonica TaxID=1529436 RepID=UPI001425AACD|nr:protein FAM72A-like [Anneissia japonica]